MLLRLVVVVAVGVVVVVVVVDPPLFSANSRSRCFISSISRSIIDFPVDEGVVGVGAATAGAVVVFTDDPVPRDKEFGFESFLLLLTFALLLVRDGDDVEVVVFVVGEFVLVVDVVDVVFDFTTDAVVAVDVDCSCLAFNSASLCANSYISRCIIDIPRLSGSATGAGATTFGATSSFCHFEEALDNDNRSASLLAFSSRFSASARCCFCCSNSLSFCFAAFFLQIKLNI